MDLSLSHARNNSCRRYCSQKCQKRGECSRLCGFLVHLLPQMTIRYCFASHLRMRILLWTVVAHSLLTFFCCRTIVLYYKDWRRHKFECAIVVFSRKTGYSANRQDLPSRQLRFLLVLHTWIHLDLPFKHFYIQW